MIKALLLQIHAHEQQQFEEEFDLFESQECGLEGIKSELDLYLDESRLDRKQNMELDILCYWKANSARYPDLSFLTRDVVLSIPITTVASEAAFSIGGRIIGKFRSSIVPKNAEALLCTQDWQHNANVVEEEDEEEEELVEDFEERAALIANMNISV
ncbi:hypothetical protein RHMOL_Rhmol04G0315800 [Rhododendron molle]|uniref:Uncharacterized protein n=1 Tax=Rhododendron molle TaxID=49168 RepID=A0ACC0P8U2_RHOML|nr:hypothetical protein RHMOL_Rhmol04G0315800 [Rhododendron molle]